MPLMVNIQPWSLAMMQVVVVVVKVVIVVVVVVVVVYCDLITSRENPQRSLTPFGTYP